MSDEGVEIPENTKTLIGPGSPVTNEISPRFVADRYLDKDNDTEYVAKGVKAEEWVQVGSSYGMKMGNATLFSANAFSANVIYATRHMCAYTTAVNHAILTTHATGAFNMKCAIYDDNAGAPGDLLGITTPVAIGAGDDYWDFRVTFTSAISLTGGSSYWFAHLSDATATLYYASSGATSKTVYASGENYADGFDDPWPGTNGANLDASVAIY